MTKLPGFLEKLFSKAASEKIAELIRAQPTATTKEEGDANHAAVVEGDVAFVEHLDDKVALIPYAGPILAVIVDTPAMDQKEREWVEFAVELAYRTLDSVGAVAPSDGPVSDPATYKPNPNDGKPTTADDFAPSMATNPPGVTK